MTGQHGFGFGLPRFPTPAFALPIDPGQQKPVYRRCQPGTHQNHPCSAFAPGDISLCQYDFWRRQCQTTWKIRPGSECTVCYAAHDEEIHQATLSIHLWFHHQVIHDFQDDVLYLPALAPG